MTDAEQDLCRRVAMQERDPLGVVNHTAAPWVVDVSKITGRPLGISAPGDKGIPGAVGCVVRHNGIGLPSSPVALANARLIAAAPDLLAALKRMRAITHQHISPACDAADAAIAKAEGR